MTPCFPPRRSWIGHAEGLIHAGETLAWRHDPRRDQHRSHHPPADLLGHRLPGPSRGDSVGAWLPSTVTSTDNRTAAPWSITIAPSRRSSVRSPVRQSRRSSRPWNRRSAVPVLSLTRPAFGSALAASRPRAKQSEITEGRGFQAWYRGSPDQRRSVIFAGQGRSRSDRWLPPIAAACPYYGHAAGTAVGLRAPGGCSVPIEESAGVVQHPRRRTPHAALVFDLDRARRVEPVLAEQADGHPGSSRSVSSRMAADTCRGCIRTRRPSVIIGIGPFGRRRSRCSCSRAMHGGMRPRSRS